jgi:PPOX class probable FMN-dependent enzyme
MVMEHEASKPVSGEVAALRRHYDAPLERAVLKVRPALDRHMRQFVALSPFVVIGSSSAEGTDVTPRGDQPGFVHVLDDNTLLVPDWPGNNRLDTLTNVVSNPQVGMLFLIPGVDETLRVNGVAAVTLEPALLQRWQVGGRHPRSVLRVAVREAYLHCGKALIRSRLWRGDYAIERDRLPSYGQMLKDQIDTPQTSDEIQASVADGYKTRLY